MGAYIGSRRHCHGDKTDCPGTIKHAACRLISRVVRGKDMLPLVNATRPGERSYVFGPHDDEVFIGRPWDVPVVFFAGSDTAITGPTTSRTASTASEWIDNVHEWCTRKAGRELYDEVCASLPSTHRTDGTVVVGFSRGGMLMSIYAKHAPASEVSTCIFVGSPGESYDCTKKCRVIDIFHVADPVCALASFNQISSDYTIKFGSSSGCFGRGVLKGVLYHAYTPLGKGYCAEGRRWSRRYGRSSPVWGALTTPMHRKEHTGTRVIDVPKRSIERD